MRRCGVRKRYPSIPSRTRAVSAITLGLLFAATLAAQSGPNEALARELLVELVGIRSSEAYPQNTVKLLEGVAERMRRAGFDRIDFVPTEKVTNLVVRYPGTGKRRPLLLMAHVDVVDADPAAWQADPFTLAEIDGYFYGRGTSDNKTGAVSLIANFIRLKREGYQPDRDLIMLLTGNEETSMTGIKEVAENRLELIDAEMAINTDSGGISLNDDGSPRAVGIQMSEKLYQTFVLETTNPGGHSSVPRPDNAIYQLAEVLLRISHHRFPVEMNEIVHASIRARAENAEGGEAELLKRVAADQPDPEAVRLLAAKEPRFNSSIRTTCVATMLQSGVAENALPRSAKATVNCRILAGHTPEEVEAALREVIADDSVKITRIQGGGAPSPPSPLREDVMQTLKAISAEFWGPAPVIPSQSTGATDGLWIRRAGIPVYGFSGKAGKAGESRAHGLDERVGVDSFYTAVRAWYRILKAFSS